MLYKILFIILTLIRFYETCVTRVAFIIVGKFVVSLPVASLLNCQEVQRHIWYPIYLTYPKIRVSRIFNGPFNNVPPGSFPPSTWRPADVNLHAMHFCGRIKETRNLPRSFNNSFNGLCTQVWQVKPEHSRPRVRACVSSRVRYAWPLLARCFCVIILPPLWLSLYIHYTEWGAW